MNRTFWLALLLPGACTVAWQLEDLDGDGFTLADGDCNDLDPTVFPGADEVCDGVDNDCNGLVDDDPVDGTLWYWDRDGDGFGNLHDPVVACTQPDGTTDESLATDCDDEEADSYPGNIEVPGDGIDQNCNGRDFCVDLTCDGVPSLVIAGYREPVVDEGGSEWETEILVFSGTEDRRFAPTPTLTIGAHSVEKLVVTDLNGSGYLDLVWISGEREGLGAVNVLYGTTGPDRRPDYSGPPTRLIAYRPTDLHVVDIDNDGALDIVVASSEEAGNPQTHSYVYLGLIGVFANENRLTLPSRGARALVPADVDGDGKLDLVACHELRSNDPEPDYDTNSRIYWNDGGQAPSFSAFKNISTHGCIDVAIADLNGDERPDVIFAERNPFSNATVSSKVIYNDGDRFAVLELDALSTAQPRSVRVADLDADGRPDLMFGFTARPDTDDEDSQVEDEGAIQIFLNSSGGFPLMPQVASPLASAVWFPEIIPGTPARIVAPSYTDDADATSFLLTVQETNPLALFSTALPVDGARRVALIDVDGDGNDELLFTTDLGEAPVLTILYRGDGTSIAETLTLETPSVRAAPVFVGEWPTP